MKKSIFLLLILTSVSVFSQNSDYKVSSYLTDGTKAPNTHYIGEAWLNAIIHDDEPVILKEGDIIKCQKNIEHWHSSSKLSDVTYLALYGGGEPTSWTEVVTQEYYDEVAEKLKSN
mgnify:CR=1 FL=1